MNTTASALPKQSGLLIALRAVIAAALVTAIMLDIHTRFGISDRSAFFILASASFALCGMGRLGQGQVYGWWNPRHILGYILGSMLVLLAAGVLFHLPIPLVSSESTALAALAVLVLVKIGVAVTYPRLK